MRRSGGKYLASALEETTLAGHHTRGVSSSHEGEQRDGVEPSHLGSHLVAGVVAVDSRRGRCEAVEKRPRRGTGSDAQRVKSSGEVEMDRGQGRAGEVEVDRGQGRAVRSEGRLLASRAPGERREEALFVWSG